MLYITRFNAVYCAKKRDRRRETCAYLLVEDDKLIGDGIKAGLSKMGFSIDWFTAGLAGQKCAYTARPTTPQSLTCTLPGIDGLDILREWRDKGRQRAGTDPDRPRCAEPAC